MERIRDKITRAMGLRSDNKEDRNADSKVDWRVRDKAILEIADVHPVTVRQLNSFLFIVGLAFTSYQAARRRCARLEKNKKLRFQGRVLAGDCGRPSDVFCRWNVKRDWLRHEWLLTEFFLGLTTTSVIRGYEVNQVVKPDAEMVMNGQRWFVEMDTGECGYADVMKRFKIYQDSECKVVWVTQRDSRRDGLRRRFEPKLCTCYFTTLGSGHWLDKEGNTR